MRAITPELEAHLKDALQAGPQGFRARVEIRADVITCQAEGPTADGHYPPLGSFDADATGTVQYLSAAPGGDGWPIRPAPFRRGSWYYPTLHATAGVFGATPDGFTDIGVSGDGGGLTWNHIRLLVIGPGTMTVRLAGYGDTVDAKIAGSLWYAEPSPSLKSFVEVGDLEFAYNGETVITIPNDGHCFHYVDVSGKPAGMPNSYAGFAGMDWVGNTTAYADVFPSSVELDKSLRMTSDQAEVVIANEDLVLGWGAGGALLTNSRLRIYQWYGDPANEILSFTGVVDAVRDHRDVLTTTITCRDMMAILIDQTFGATAPQAAGEAGAVRTKANGVYLSMEISDIVSDILDRAGWPVADRAITPTSYVLDEYIIDDGTSWAEAIIGDDKLTGMVGYDGWADEDGVFHFAPTFTAGALTDPGIPVYTFRSGEDITALDDALDQYDLRTRVKVRGPFTTTVLTDTWRELWRTSKLRYPVGLWYDPSLPADIRVLDRGTKRIYRIRQSDRVVLGSSYVGGAIPYPLGLSGDPGDASVYWVLNAPWKFTGSTTGNSVKKVRKSDSHVLASYALPNGRWTDLKVSAAYIWLTNLDTDRFYKRDKADASAIADYAHIYGGVTQLNPSGLMVDGTTLYLFWANGGTTARFLVCSESAPTTITKAVRTTGTVLVGGEMDTTTHTECWGSSDTLGLVAKFTLVAKESMTTEVYAEVVDTALEDELGDLAESQPRTHDTHPGDGAHAFEIRRDTVDLTAITSLAQATETAMRRLDRLSDRRRVVDVGILGNPALQKSDLVRVEDPVTGLAEEFTIDTYRSAMAAEGTYLGTLALIPVLQPDDAPVDDGDVTE